MTPKLESARYIRGFTIHIRFSDGAEADVDLENELWGEVFEPLREVDVFRRFQLDRELNTLTWPTGADLAPEYLYELASGPQTSRTDRTSSRSS